MQTVLDRQKLRLNKDQPDESRTESKIITRKQDKRPNDHHFKKKQSHHDSKEKRYHSSHELKFVKSHSAAEDKDHGINTLFNIEEIIASPKEKDSNRNSPTKESPRIEKKKSLVFNKFTHHEKQQIRQMLNQIRNDICSIDAGTNLKDFYQQIEDYISRIEQNNTKLLEVNYFFQKEFNQLIAEKQLAKRVEKCSKNYCMECRYHLEKENRWKQEKIELQNQITRLREELSSIQTSKIEEYSQDPSIVAQETCTDVSDIRQSLVRLREELQEKDQEYLILLKEFNYLDSINKDLKNRMSKVMEDYKYLAIENRTLLNIKTKLIQKEIQCTKFKDERDYFKRKIIDQHKRHEEQKLKGEGCKCAIAKEQSIFSLSSASNLSSMQDASDINNPPINQSSNFNQDA